MSSVVVPNTPSLETPFRNPWPALVTGILATAVGSAWLAFLGDAAPLPRIGLLVIGLLAAGAAIAIRPSSPLVLGLAGLAGFFGRQAMDPAWDSLRVALFFLTGLAALAAVLMMLPQVLRRLAVSLIILFHFGGILVAVTSVNPQPWLSGYLWARVYRPYLQFLYLNNAYHFYSPNPGPATLMWFRIQYADGTARWVKVPNRSEYPLAVNYQRRLAMTESINQLIPPQPQVPDHIKWARLKAAHDTGVRVHPDMPETVQYREPLPFSKKMTESYVRHAAAHYPHLNDPSQPVVAIKVYRVIHSIVGPRDLIVRRGQFDDEIQYLPYFYGEFRPDGTMINPADPMLYWLIPIFRVPKSGVALKPQNSPDFRYNPDEWELENYLEIHSGDKK
jgi:hypothetical protein